MEKNGFLVGVSLVFDDSPAGDTFQKMVNERVCIFDNKLAADSCYRLIVETLIMTCHNVTDRYGIGNEPNGYYREFYNDASGAMVTVCDYRS